MLTVSNASLQKKMLTVSNLVIWSAVTLLLIGQLLHLLHLYNISLGDIVCYIVLYVKITFVQVWQKEFRALPNYLLMGIFLYIHFKLKVGTIFILCEKNLYK